MGAIKSCFAHGVLSCSWVNQRGESWDLRWETRTMRILVLYLFTSISDQLMDARLLLKRQISWGRLKLPFKLRVSKQITPSSPMSTSSTRAARFLRPKMNGRVIFADPARHRNFNYSPRSFTFHILLAVGRCRINIAYISRF
jgi:hypothetical protein